MNRICFSKVGISLVAILVLLLILGVSISVATSLIGTGTIGSLHTAESAQALGIAHGGVEWLLEKLETETNWSQANLNAVYGGDHAYGAGKFNIAIGASAPSSSPTKVSFTSSGLVTNPDDVSLSAQRQITITAFKLPPAFLFALYQGSDTGTLNIRLSSTITGDMWTLGSVAFSTGGGASTITDGIVYTRTGETITPVAIPRKIIPDPIPSMPVITTPNSHTDLMDTYDGQFGLPNGGDCDINNQTLDLGTGGTVVCAAGTDFITRGNSTITGSGTIIAKRHMLLHDNEPTNDTLTITPTGGEIVFLSSRNLAIGTTTAPATNNPNITINPGCRFYARSSGAVTDHMIIGGSDTEIHGAKFYARRRIRVLSGAILFDQNSLLYVDRVASATNNNNWLEIDGGATTVSGSLISTGQNIRNLRITGGATVSGLVYSFDIGGTNGRAELNNCTITGSVVADRYNAGGTNNRINQAIITYDPTVFPDPPPEGFQGYATKQPNSWDGV